MAAAKQVCHQPQTTPLPTDLRIWILFLTAFTASLSVSAQVSNCPPNIDFEEGNLEHWQFGTGNCCPVNTTPVGAAIPNRHTLRYGSDVDPYGLFPVVPPGSGKYVLQLGNNSSGGQAEQASYTFVVPSNMSEFGLLYKYAIVLEDPDHPASGQPRFEVKVYQKGSSVPLSCASFTYIASAGLPGFKPSNVNSAIIYRDWSLGSIDLTPYLGDTLVLEFSTGDCAYGGHFGYAYIDVSCSGSNVNAIFCKSDSVLNLQAPPGFQQYYWYNNNFSQLIDSGLAITIPQPDLSSFYNVIVQPYAGYGCVDTFKTDIFISDFSIFLSDSATVCNKETFQLFPAVKGNSNAYSYQWSPTEGLSCSTCLNPVFSPTLPIRYHLTVTDEKGCVLHDSTKIFPSPLACCQHVFIPNAFSPDNNGLNDLFTARTEIELPMYRLSVFNRWGQGLYQTKSIHTGWNGRYQNEPQPLGTYFYLLEYQCGFNKKKYNKSGDFILVR